MRFLLFFTISILFLHSCTDNKNELIRNAQSQIETISKKYVKDKRTAYFKIEANQNNGQLILTGETAIKEAYEELTNQLSSTGISFVDSINLLPSKELNGKIKGIVNVSVCNIRSNPKHSAELGTQALLGTPLRVWKKQGDFYFIQTPDNYFGWVDDGGLTLMTNSEFEEWQNKERVVVLHDFEFLLEKPEPGAAKISDLTAGGILQLIGNNGGYSKLAFPDGRTGYLSNSALLPYPEWLSTSKANAENILASAHEFLGRPYLWGGTSGKGVDCSGFTKTVYYLNGIQLERDASLQVHTGELIETDTSTWKNLLPGDLLFFGRHATAEKGERISHVAIYMGDGKIIHSSDRVKIESLKRGDESFVEGRVKTFIRAKRMIGSEGKNGVVALKDSEWYK